ncbi:MAG: hypothetical protein SGPRY_011123 [Prymnesium sp.]
MRAYPIRRVTPDGFRRSTSRGTRRFSVGISCSASKTLQRKGVSLLRVVYAGVDGDCVVQSDIIKTPSAFAQFLLSKCKSNIDATARIKCFLSGECAVYEIKPAKDAIKRAAA